MKRKFSILIVGMVIIGLALSLVGTALVSQAAPSERPEKPDKQKPVPATDVELVKKTTIGKPGHAGEHGGGQGKAKKNEFAATGELGAPVTGNTYAIVIGISNYPPKDYTPYEDNDLKYADDDALEMYDALVNIYGFKTDNVTLLTDLDATRAAILTAIENIPGDAGEVVFFFSGHGTRGIAGDGDKEKMDEAIAVVKNDLSDWEPIWDGELRDAFSGFATSRIIFAFDTCLAGGMKKDLEEPGRVIAMATTERDYAYESAEWENGEFSYYFVDQGILGGNANVHDYDFDEILREPEQVTVEEAFDYAKANCTKDKPTIGDYFENDLLL